MESNRTKQAPILRIANALHVTECSMQVMIVGLTIWRFCWDWSGSYWVYWTCFGGSDVGCNIFDCCTRVVRHSV